MNIEKVKITIVFALKIYFSSVVSFVISAMIFFLGYAVSLVILEGVLGNDKAVQQWVTIISGTIAIVVFIAIWISLLYLGKTWGAPIKNAVKYLVSLLSFIAAIITVFGLAVYLARLT